MIIKPQVRGFICTTAHPEGCARHVEEQIAYVKNKPRLANGPKNALIIGASTGYGLASRIVAAFGAGANTLGVFFERPAQDKRTASPGWYNTAAFDKAAAQAGLISRNVNGDAFSDDLKNQAIDLIKRDFGQVDLVVYSLASPRRTHPRTGQVHTSTLKPVGKPYTSKTINVMTGQVTQMTLEPATEEEIANTVAVMGGEDWDMWMEALMNAGVLAKGAVTVAYSYIGPQVTDAIYRSGTIGRAKDHLETSTKALDQKMKKVGGRALISVNKAVVTQASAAIPVVPLYIAGLFKIMKQKGLHEDCIEQMHRLFSTGVYGKGATLDEKGRLRLDDWEMRDDVQKEIMAIWENVNTENAESMTDLQGYRDGFVRLFGFGLPNVNYEAETNPEVPVDIFHSTPA